MALLTRRRVLDTLIRHETLTLEDIGDPINLGMKPDNGQLKFILAELRKCGYVDVLNGVSPVTYTITEKGIADGTRLDKEGSVAF